MYIIDLTKKWNIIKDKNLLSHLKMGEKTSTLVLFILFIYLLLSLELTK